MMIRYLWSRYVPVAGLCVLALACSTHVEDKSDVSDVRVTFAAGSFTLAPVNTQELATDDIPFKVSVNGTAVTGAQYTVKIGDDDKVHLHSSKYDSSSVSGPVIKALEAAVDDGDADETEVVFAVDDGGKATLKGDVLQAWVDLLGKDKFDGQFADTAASPGALGAAFSDILAKLPKK